MEKSEFTDFGEIEEEFEIEIHDSIKQYFNSYWFMELNGFFESYNLSLEPVLPGSELENFYSELKEYKINHNGNLKYIPIGFESESGFAIVIDNETGVVMLLEDDETNEYSMLTKSLQELISQIKFNI